MNIQMSRAGTRLNGRMVSGGWFSGTDGLRGAGCGSVRAGRRAVVECRKIQVAALTRSPVPALSIAETQDHGRSVDEIAALFLAEWRGALIAAEAHALTSMYAHDALFFGSAATLRRGHAEILDYFMAVPKGYVRDAVFSDVQTAPIASDVIVVASLVDFDLESNGTRELRKWRITWTLARDGTGLWRIAAHHAGPKGSETDISSSEAPTAASEDHKKGS